MSASLASVRACLASLGVRPRRLAQLATNLSCVLAGVKAAFLWDLGPVPSPAALPDKTTPRSP